ncbi:MAG: hypothetical protein NVS3B3_18380 [Aquirhabdus sp.]
MNLKQHWSTIKSVVERGQASSIHCAIASVDSEGIPNVTPVGTVFLRDNQTGFYFDQYTNSLAKNLETNPNICLMTVNTRSSFWLKSFVIGRFISPPGVRLYGTVSALRPATQEELAKIGKRIKLTRWMKGSKLLWSDFTHVRDIHFTSFRPVTYPEMMDGLWE